MVFIIILSCLLGCINANIRNFMQNESLYDLLKMNRVIGGKNCEKGEFPHQVSLQFRDSNLSLFIHMCGGSIIANRWILTAGHCVRDSPSTGILIIKAGKHSIKTKEASEQTAYVMKVYLHTQYQGGSSPYDIALIKLLKPLKFNKYVAPIHLPQPHSLPRGIGILSGWGSISTSNEIILPDILQKVTLPIIDLETCRQAFRVLGEKWDNVHDTHVCTGPLTGGYSACRGDSGGPLIGQNKYGRPEIIGVVSWGLMPCGSYGAPAVFIKVSAFVDWINYIMRYDYYL